MAIATTVTFSGLKGLQKAMAGVKRKLRRRLRNRLRESIGLVQRSAKTRTTSRRVRSAFSTTIHIKSRSEFEAITGTLFRRAFFAHFLERGTKASGRRPWTTRAFPFLEPALESNQNKILRIMERTVKFIR